MLSALPGVESQNGGGGNFHIPLRHRGANAHPASARKAVLHPPRWWLSSSGKAPSHSAPATLLLPAILLALPLVAPVNG